MIRSFKTFACRGLPVLHRRRRTCIAVRGAITTVTALTLASAASFERACQTVSKVARPEKNQPLRTSRGAGQSLHGLFRAFSVAELPDWEWWLDALFAFELCPECVNVPFWKVCGRVAIRGECSRHLLTCTPFAGPIDQELILRDR